MFRKILSTISILLFVAAGTAAGQLKIGYMNPQEVLNQLPEKADIEQQLNDLVEQKRQQLQNRTANFQDAVAEYQDNSSSMSEEQRNNREQELAEMEQALYNFQRSIQAEVQQRRNELLAPIFDRMDKAISEISEARGLDFVINESVGTGESIIFFASDTTMNITQEVLNRMNSETN